MTNEENVKLFQTIMIKKGNIKLIKRQFCKRKEEETRINEDSVKLL